jgi:hypothetical protein
MLWIIGVILFVVWLDLHGGLHFIRRAYWNDSQRRRGIRLESFCAAIHNDHFFRACDRAGTDSRDERKGVRRLVVVPSLRSCVPDQNAADGSNQQPEEALEISLARAA